MIKRGLVFGKFMPPHKGHLALIAFAKSKCDKVIVSMSYTPNDPIDSELRFAWLNTIFKDDAKIEVVKYLDDFHDENLPIFEATKLWAAFIKQEFPDIEAFFCSESYGEPLSLHLGLPCILFDKERTEIPISATKIRENPYQNWAFIPNEVKPYFVKKICLFGPESVGKTVLSQRLAALYNTDFVHEVARDILTSNDAIDEQVILEIGQKQTELVKKKMLMANRILFCDTDVITTQIYARHYLGFIPNQLFELELEVNYDLYFLLDIDAEWVYDPLRDLKDKRAEMLEIFKFELEKRKINYIKISGNWEQRMNKIVQEINKVFPDISI